jgi:probable HAF family extracellular repeat protein
MHDLGTLGGVESEATAINDKGTIIGYSEVTGTTTTKQAFNYRHGKMTDLGTLAGSKESFAYALNDFGEIVGLSGERVEGPGEIRECDGIGNETGFSGHAFLYRHGAMVDLNTLLPPNSGWTLTIAKGINDSGEIVGTGFHNGVKRGFLLTPNRGRHECPPSLWLCHPQRGGRGH